MVLEWASTKRARVNTHVVLEWRHHLANLAFALSGVPLLQVWWFLAVPRLLVRGAPRQTAPRMWSGTSIRQYRAMCASWHGQCLGCTVRKGRLQSIHAHRRHFQKWQWGKARTTLMEWDLVGKNEDESAELGLTRVVLAVARFDTACNPSLCILRTHEERHRQEDVAGHQDAF